MSHTATHYDGPSAVGATQQMTDEIAMTDGADVLELTDSPTGRGELLGQIADHFDVLIALARKDFQTRYKRATLGVLWAVAVPVLQASVMAFVFAKVIKFSGQNDYAPFVMVGVIPWTYFAATISVGSTAIVDNSSLTEKVWFPRALLPIVPGLSGLIGYVVSLAVVIALVPIFDVSLGPKLLLLVPASLLLVALSVAFSLVLAALHVYFRDVRYLVQAALLVWMYVTPILYPQSLLGRFSWWLDFNPMTGVVDLFRWAVLGTAPGSGRALVMSVVWTVVLAVAALEGHRRHDRLFADQL